jgi:hypothetical protein
MSLIRVGSTSKYADGWDSIFGGRKGSKASASAKKPAPKAVKKKASRLAKKKAVTKASKPGKSRRG